MANKVGHENNEIIFYQTKFSFISESLKNIETMKIINNYIIALIWFVNGLICKVFNFVPRHAQIVEKILGFEYFGTIRLTIGILEILMGFWVLSRIQSRANAILQIFLIIVMNILEFFLAPELLLWGQFNAFFALIFVLFIYFNEFNIFKLNTSKN